MMLLYVYFKIQNLQGKPASHHQLSVLSASDKASS